MQTPASVDYVRATSVAEALDLLERRGPEAQLLAGGHSLIPMMRIRVAQPECVIDINHIPGLDYIRIDSAPEGGNDLCIGALTRHRSVLESPVAAEHYALLAEAERVIADPIVRNWGTVGGSLCQADPAEDLSAVAAALKAQLVLQSSGGMRVVPAREFAEGPYQTVLDDAEMLVEVRIPVRPGSGSAYEKVERRAGDWAIAAAGAFVVLDGDIVVDAGIGLAALGAAHSCAPEAESYLIGKTLGADTIAETARLASTSCQPVADQRGPVAYKRHLADELTRRVLRRAADRAHGGIAL